MGSAYNGTLFLRSSIRIQERKEKGVGVAGPPRAAYSTSLEQSDSVFMARKKTLP